jgi:hypothetical protein
MKKVVSKKELVERLQAQGLVVESQYFKPSNTEKKLFDELLVLLEKKSVVSSSVVLAPISPEPLAPVDNFQG